MTRRKSVTMYCGGGRNAGGMSRAHEVSIYQTKMTTIKESTERSSLLEICFFFLSAIRSSFHHSVKTMSPQIHPHPGPERPLTSTPNRRSEIRNPGLFVLHCNHSLISCLFSSGRHILHN